MDILTRPLSRDPENGLHNSTYPVVAPKVYTTYGKNAPPFYEILEEPPTSTTLFQSIHNTKEQVARSYKLWEKCGTLIFCSITIIVILAILMAIPISMIVVGIFKLNECPIQKLIPLWLIIAGGLSIAKNISTLVQRIKSIKTTASEKSGSNTILNIFDSLMTLFLFGWFITGNIYVYGILKEVKFEDKTSDKYCDLFTYYFAFWIITSIYILLLLSCFLFCCTICFTIFITPKK